MNNHDQDEPLSRKAYREAQERANARHPSRDNDGLLHRPSREKTFQEPDTAGQKAAESRESEFQKSLTPEEKTTRLKRRLNKAILVLIALIVIVYLVLFFVG